MLTIIQKNFAINFAGKHCSHLFSPIFATQFTNHSKTFIQNEIEELEFDISRGQEFLIFCQILMNDPNTISANNGGKFHTAMRSQSLNNQISEEVETLKIR
jgi:hypothetical protein